MALLHCPNQHIQLSLSTFCRGVVEQRSGVLYQRYRLDLQIEQSVGSCKPRVQAAFLKLHLSAGLIMLMELGQRTIQYCLVD